MQGFYNILTRIKYQLEQDPMVNTVTTGDIFEIDLNKQTIFPLCHLMVNNATLEENVWRFNISVFAMDVVDISKELVTDNFYGNTNEQDILNTQLAVLNRLYDVLNRGTLAQDLYVLANNPTNEPFTERFENNLAGWVGTFEVIIPNEMTACDSLPFVTPSCEAGHYIINDQDGNLLEDGYIASGGEETIVINVGGTGTVYYLITDSIGNTLYEGTASETLEIAIQDTTIENTDASFTDTALAESNYVLPDTTFNVYVSNVLQDSITVPTLKDETINIVWQ